jgi:hypothetical protein
MAYHNEPCVVANVSRYALYRGWRKKQSGRRSVCQISDPATYRVCIPFQQIVSSIEAVRSSHVIDNATIRFSRIPAV